MLTDQGSAYVGRFARGWHRLPGIRSRGNHRPGRGPVAEYRPRPPCRGHGSSRGEQANGLGPGPQQRRSARPSRRAGGEHVVDEHDRARCLLGREHPAHRLATRGRASARLRSGVADTSEEREGWRTDHGCHRSRERAPGRTHGPRAGRASGTQVTALGVHGTSAHASTMAPARASATARHPPNFSRWTARRIGPSNPNGARAIAIGSGGQSRHAILAREAGAPHRSHHGGDSTTSSERHLAQNGHGPEPHPAHRFGNNASSSEAATARTLPRPADRPSRRPTAGRCRPRPPTPCRVPSAPRAGPRRYA